MQVSIGGRPVGQPFDAYAPDVDREGERASFGTMALTAGDHEVGVAVTGRNAKSSNCLISVKRWLLREAAR